MANQLGDENSPYLLQHKDNPVDWYPWNAKALKRAKVENKPIFLSIGYAACHWCHVMERESFEDPETAALMNEHFINIKVDREERPDLDNIYMNAVVAMTGQGGWPMSIFLTPEREPFFGGTYFPPIPRFGMPSFKEVLQNIARTWKYQEEKVRESSSKIVAHINKTILPTNDHQPLTKETLTKAAMKLAQSYDWHNGGWGRAPKFPQPMAIQFLLRQASRGDKMALDITAHALTSMAQGGMYDLVGGGFSRYSVDDGWLVPHFEKMLYDNALLARAYLHGYLLTGNSRFKHICEATLDFVIHEMTNSQGGFYSSLDADSEGEEGKYYLWDYQELKEILGDKEFAILTQAFSISQQGNFEGKIVLRRTNTDGELANLLDHKAEQIPHLLGSIYQKLRDVRGKRIRPATDDKALTAWNAWMSVAFSEAARYFKSDKYLKVAVKNMEFLLSNLYQDGRLYRSWRNAVTKHDAYLEDYAGLILALLSLYQSNPQVKWFQHAQNLLTAMIDQFEDPRGGFYDTGKGHEPLVIRPKDIQDNATPSGNSLAAMALLHLSAYNGNLNLYDRALLMLSGLQGYLADHPTAFSNWLCAANFAVEPVQEIAILGALERPETQAFLDVVWQRLRPNTVVAASSFPPEETAPALLHGRTTINGHPTAYVCRQFVCKTPTTNVDEFKELVDNSSQ